MTAVASAPSLPDRWQLGRVLGTGGYGVVYEAFDRERSARVALKELRRIDAASIYNFKQEFRSLADLVHPNLVALHELFNAGGSWFFTMDIVEGVPFHQWVRPEGDLATAETVNLNDVFGPGVSGTLPRGSTRGPGTLNEARLRDALRQLSVGVSALHEAGKLHRDLKPSNVLVTRDGHVVILDFGLVTDVRARSSQPSEISGTPEYMSPEQAAGENVDAASDWYAFGVMLFEALTGRPPYVGSMMEVLANKHLGKQPDPRVLAQGIPDDLATLCMELLRVDRTTRPSGAQIRERLGSSEPISITSRESSRRIPVRERELRELHTLFEKHGVVHVHGASGMGKSTLLRWFLDDIARNSTDSEGGSAGVLDAHRPIVLEGRCFERETVPYNAFDSLIDSLSEWLLMRPDAEAMLPRDAHAIARLFPVLRRVPAIPGPRTGEVPDARELRRRAFQALRELLAAVADRGPLVLFIDDIQWADRDSLELLQELLRDPPPMMVLLADREERGFAFDVKSMAIGPLSAQDGERLAGALLGDVTRRNDKAGAIARESGGSPFFIAELSRYVREGGQAEEEISLEKVLGDRLTRLPDHARALLELLAIAGAPLPVPVLRRAANEHIEALPTLRAMHLVRRAHDTDLEIFHARIREAILPGVVDRKARHRALAEALEAHDGDPEMLATHFASAGEEGRAFTYVVRAAERAESALAFDRAVALYRRALELKEDRAIQRKLGDALVNAGRGSEAADAYLAALDGSSGDFELRRRAGEQLLRCGRVDEGITLLRSVLGDVGVHLPESPRRALMKLLWTRFRLRLRGLSYQLRSPSEDELHRVDACWSAACGLSMVSVVRGADFQARHLLLALDAGEPFRLARAFAMEASLVGVAGERAEKRSEALLTAATPLAERVGDPHAVAWIHGARGVIAYFRGRFSTALGSLEKAERTLRDHCTGIAWDLTTSHLFSLAALFYLGRVSELCERMQTWLDEARGRGDLYAEVNLRTAYGNMMWLAEDDPERALRESDEAVTRWSKRGFLLQHWYGLRARGFIDLYRGACVTGYAHLCEKWPRLMGSLLARAQHTLIEAHLLRARLAVGAAAELGDTRLLRDAERSLARIAKERAPCADAQAMLIHAAIAAQRGKDAAPLLERAAEACDGLELTLFAAAARHKLSETSIRAPERFAAMLTPGFPAPRALP
jgi:eukaryotic-like serine/threonine-protein kinase